MQLWTCPDCAHTVYFDNDLCLRCGTPLGFLPDRLRLTGFSANGNDLWQTLGESGAPAYRRCSNYGDHGICNWMVPAADDNPLCRSCRLNRTIPDLSVDDHRVLWQRLEAEKRRLIYGLLRLRLPLMDRQQDPEGGLAFDFLADAELEFHEGPAVVTGHADGLITLNVAEADDSVRERMRQDMAEPYRTILGHFRHESGHYYWDRLVRDSDWLAPVRDLFGDQELDYVAALEQHYQQGPPADWRERFVSHYASSHPWEDWAETWAHYLHIVDTLETAWQFGMRVRPQVEESSDLSLRRAEDPYREHDFDALIDDWLPLTYALNNLNRSMGQPDAYPFVLSGPAITKLGLVHAVISSVRDGS